ncbi:hypothetical protein HDU76_005032, partial [Blyttiomyces sp. JEL0837]
MKAFYRSQSASVENETFLDVDSELNSSFAYKVSQSFGSSAAKKAKLSLSTEFKPAAAGKESSALANPSPVVEPVTTPTKSIVNDRNDITKDDAATTTTQPDIINPVQAADSESTEEKDFTVFPYSKFSKDEVEFYYDVIVQIADTIMRQRAEGVQE